MHHAKVCQPCFPCEHTRAISNTQQGIVIRSTHVLRRAFAQGSICNTCCRGRFDIALFEDRLLIDSPKQTIHVPYSAILSVIILDRIPKDTKGRVLLCLHLDKCVMSASLRRAAICVHPHRLHLFVH